MLRAVDAAVDAAALIARLQQHSDDPEVQAQCCEALCRSGELADEPALAFLPVIVTALRTHPGSAMLQLFGCAALGMICRVRSEAVLSAAPGAADGVRAVVEALRAHPADANLQSSCCGALVAMSVPTLRDYAVDAGAVPVVVAALHAHVLYGGGVVFICDALNVLMSPHSLARVQACAAGAMAATLAVMHEHPASADLQARGCRTLGTLTQNDAEQRKNAIHAGAIETIVLAAARAC
jgi:hypothetical protein